MAKRSSNPSGIKMYIHDIGRLHRSMSINDHLSFAIISVISVRVVLRCRPLENEMVIFVAFRKSL